MTVKQTLSKMAPNNLESMTIETIAALCGCKEYYARIALKELGLDYYRRRPFEVTYPKEEMLKARNCESFSELLIQHKGSHRSMANDLGVTPKTSRSWVRIEAQ